MISPEVVLDNSPRALVSVRGLQHYPTGAVVERGVVIAASLLSLAVLIARPEAAAAQVPLLVLGSGALASLLLPGAVVLSLWSPAENEGFCGAIARAFVTSFLIIAAGTAICLSTGLSAFAFAVVLLLLTLAGCVFGIVRRRPAYLARAWNFSWTTQTPAERIASLSLGLAVLVLSGTILVSGYPTGYMPEEIIPARKLADVAPLAPDFVMHRLGVAPTYLYPALTFAVGLLSRLSGLDVLYVSSSLMGLLVPVAMCGVVAFIGAVVRDIRVSWMAVAIILGITVVDPAAFTHDLGVFLPFVNRYGFAPGVLVPAVLYLFIRALSVADRGALVLVPLAVLGTALVHARDAAQLLIVMGGAGVALVVGDATDRRRLPRLVFMLVASAVVLLAYQSLQSRLVEHVSEVTSGLRSEFLVYFATLLRDPAQAITGVVPKTVPSLVGDWTFENYRPMVQGAFYVVTRSWLPFGLFVAAGLLGRWAPWQVRTCAWSILAALLMVRIPIVYTAISLVVGDPDVGQVSALLAILALPIAAAAPVGLFALLQRLAQRYVWNKSEVASGGLLVLLSALAVGLWLRFPAIQAAWLDTHALQKADADLLVLGSLVVAVLVPLIVVLWALRKPDNRWRSLIGAAVLAIPLFGFSGLYVQGVLQSSSATGTILAACLSLGACGVLALVVAGSRSVDDRTTHHQRGSALSTLAFVPLLAAGALTLPMLEPPQNSIPPRRYASLSAQLWGPDKGGVVRAAPQLFYADLQGTLNVKLSRDVLEYLRTSLQPLRVFYAPRAVSGAIPIVSNHYVVYFGDQRLSTDLDYYSRFAVGDKDLLFGMSPDEESLRNFSLLLRTYQVSHILVTPDFQQQVSTWLPVVNRSGLALQPIFDRDGYTIYQVNSQLLALGSSS